MGHKVSSYSGRERKAAGGAGRRSTRMMDVAELACAFRFGRDSGGVAEMPADIAATPGAGDAYDAGVAEYTSECERMAFVREGSDVAAWRERSQALAALRVGLESSALRAYQAARGEAGHVTLAGALLALAFALAVLFAGSGTATVAERCAAGSVDPCACEAEGYDVPDELAWSDAAHARILAREAQ